jgi:hypothetical protein
LCVIGSNLLNWDYTPAVTVTPQSNTSLFVETVITGLGKKITGVEFWTSLDGESYSKSAVLDVGQFLSVGLTDGSTYYYMVRLISGNFITNFSAAVSCEASWNSYWTAWCPELLTWTEDLVTPLTFDEMYPIGEWIKGLKSDFNGAMLSDIFDCFYILGAPTQETALRNLAKREHDCTLAGVGHTFISWESVCGNKTGWLRTGFVPSTDGDNFKVNDASMGIFVRDEVWEVGSYLDMGAQNTTTSLIASIAGWYTVDMFSFPINGAGGTHTPKVELKTQGLYMSNKRSAGSCDGWINDNKVSVRSLTSDGLVNFELYICGRCRNGSIHTGTQSPRSYSFAFAGRALTDTEIPKLRARMKAWEDVSKIEYYYV